MFYDVNTLLPTFRGRKFIGTSELAAIATSILSQTGTSQERGTVKEDVDERTVRYYQTEGLLDTPTEKKGPASVYGYKHLLTLVVIKQLQSHDLPIKKIKRIIQGMSESDLESILESTPTLEPKARTAKDEAKEYLEGISRTIEWEPSSPRGKINRSVHSSPRMIMSSPPQAEKEDLTSKLDGEDAGTSDVYRSVLRANLEHRVYSIIGDASPSPEEPLGESWRRFEIAPGVELSIRKDVATYTDEEIRNSILKTIEKALRFLTDR